MCGGVLYYWTPGLHASYCRFTVHFDIKSKITFICSWIFPSSKIINHTPGEVRLLEGAIWYDILSSESRRGCKLLKFQRLLFTHSTHQQTEKPTSLQPLSFTKLFTLLISPPVFFCWGCFRLLLQKKYASFSDTKKLPQNVSPLEESKLRLDSSKRCRSTWDQHIQMRKKTSGISVFLFEFFDLQKNSWILMEKHVI